MTDSTMNATYHLAELADNAGMTSEAKAKLIKNFDNFKFELDSELFEANETTIYDYDEMTIMKAYWNGQSVSETVAQLTAKVC